MCRCACYVTGCDINWVGVHLPPRIQGTEVEDGDVCTVRYVNEAMIEQQLETKIYQMSREEAKA